METGKTYNPFLPGLQVMARFVVRKDVDVPE